MIDDEDDVEVLKDLKVLKRSDEFKLEGCCKEGESKKVLQLKLNEDSRAKVEMLNIGEDFFNTGLAWSTWIVMRTHGHGMAKLEKLARKLEGGAKARLRTYALEIVSLKM